MEPERCTHYDSDSLRAFYRYVISNTPDMEVHCPWVYGKHPTDGMILKYIEDGCMYVLREDGNIIAAVALVPYQDEEYRGLDWGTSVSDDEVLVVHILAVHPDYQGRGVASGLMKAVIDIARERKLTTVRLDALSTNTPAHKLYEKCGFTPRGSASWYASNTGVTSFRLFEYIL
ncbi:MAG: GNAT family N-acetyltransferase [Bullifex sp.]